ncbi:MAG: tRNA isopentenyl-2-thiomethyl-A-37 hydroxylase MiaE [Planctomycetota bacterium]
MFRLRVETPRAWVDAVLADLDAFLRDHAANERGAHAFAMAMVARYRDRGALVTAMLGLAAEELAHLRHVVSVLAARGCALGPDRKDRYVRALRSHVRPGGEAGLLDRLVLGGITEARGHERFGMLRDALPAGELRDFYTTITASEARHHELFGDLALRYVETSVVLARVDALLDVEAKIVAGLPMRPALH